MRLFIAIDFNSLIKEKISKLQRELKEQSIKGRWKYIDNFHLTLKFLGEVEPNKISQLDTALKKVCSKIRRFKLGIKDLDCFLGRDSIRVLWLGVKDQIEELNKLVNNIEEELYGIGFEREKRQYSPHITLAQDVVFKQNFDDIKKEINDYNFEESIVDKIVLMDSQEVNGKRVYTVIGEYPLIEADNG